jgi:hypothetical protein
MRSWFIVGKMYVPANKIRKAAKCLAPSKLLYSLVFNCIIVQLYYSHVPLYVSTSIVTNIHAVLFFFFFQFAQCGVEFKLGPLGTSATSGLFYLPRMIVRMENLVE